MVGLFSKEFLLSSHTNSSVLCYNSLQLLSTRPDLLQNVDEVIFGSNITSKELLFPWLNINKCILYSKLNAKQLILKYTCIVPENRKKFSLNQSVKIVFGKYLCLCFMYLFEDIFLWHEENTCGTVKKFVNPYKTNMEARNSLLNQDVKNGTEDGLFVIKLF